MFSFPGVILLRCLSSSVTSEKKKLKKIYKKKKERKQKSKKRKVKRMLTRGKIILRFPSYDESKNVSVCNKNANKVFYER